MNQNDMTDLLMNFAISKWKSRIFLLFVYEPQAWTRPIKKRVNIFWYTCKWYLPSQDKCNIQYWYHQSNITNIETSIINFMLSPWSIETLENHRRSSKKNKSDSFRFFMSRKMLKLVPKCLKSIFMWIIIDWGHLLVGSTTFSKVGNNAMGE